MSPRSTHRTMDSSSAVNVEIVVAGPSLRMRVHDNGVGIRPEALQAQKSYGVLGIRERARVSWRRWEPQAKPISCVTR